MAEKAEQARKRTFFAPGLGKQQKRLDKTLSSKGVLYESEVAEGKRKARKEAGKQKELIARQQQEEQLQLAEAESEIAKRRALTKGGKGGRRSLLGSGYGVSLLRKQQ